MHLSCLLYSEDLNLEQPQQLGLGSTYFRYFQSHLQPCNFENYYLDPRPKMNNYNILLTLQFLCFLLLQFLNFFHVLHGFQFLIVMSICTNSALLVWMYVHEGNWKIDRGLAAILVLEHVLLLIKFSFSHLIPQVSFFISPSPLFIKFPVKDLREVTVLLNENCGLFPNRNPPG